VTDYVREHSLLRPRTPDPRADAEHLCREATRTIYWARWQIVATTVVPPPAHVAYITAAWIIRLDSLEVAVLAGCDVDDVVRLFSGGTIPVLPPRGTDDFEACRSLNLAERRRAWDDQQYAAAAKVARRIITTNKDGDVKGGCPHRRTDAGELAVALAKNSDDARRSR
jgi:hypothetical protein